METIKVFKKGQRIMIYQDPITKQKPEGMAKLFAKMQQGKNQNLELWRVLFDGDSPFELSDRWICNVVEELTTP